MDGEADLAAVASLMGEPARAKALMALADGRALAASTLAAEACVAASTISGHLARLVDGGLITVETSGRHRYYRLASPAVAEALEALARLAPAAPVRSLRQSTHARAIRSARTCYDHLAGRLGVALCDALVAQQILGVERGDGAGSDPVLGAGRAMRFELTATGRRRLDDLGVGLDPPGRRPMVRYCVDWSEQRPHLGGFLGAALCSRLVELGWVVRAERRVVRVTDAGRRALADQLAVRLDILAR
ncbi:MAG: ArsR/SmtB family transcription factor [Streptosporangiaceae bacterium]